jgi:hypothetical protein
LSALTVAGKTRAVSRDGYIRLSLANPIALPFLHLFSETDDGFLKDLRAQAAPARAPGFSAWKSDSCRRISIGWGEFIDSRSARKCPAPDGVRSNVMPIDAVGYDLSRLKTSNLLWIWADDFEWQPSVGIALDDAKSCQL